MTVSRGSQSSRGAQSLTPGCGVRALGRGLVGLVLISTTIPGLRTTAEEAAVDASAPAPKAAGIRFEEAGERAGVRLTHSTRDFGDRHKAQVLQMFTDGGAAVAVGDFDNDGRDDLFVVDSDTGKPHHLMRNLGPGDDGVPRFADVAAAAGVAGGNDPLSICADALWLDFDNDGWRDLLVARFGTPILYRNLGPDASGTIRFEDVSVAAGLTAFGNTIAAIAFDYDRDGFLDLMLGNYFQPKNLLDLDTPHVLPNNLDYADNGGGVSFWHNVEGEDGSRRFVEITAEAGLADHTGWSLDLGHADLDNDGWQDVYVAGDYGTDRLFMNREGEGGGRIFQDVTAKAMGLDTKKGMNVDFGDYDRDGFLDVYVTNITDEYMKECNFLWHNNGDGTLIDLARETGTCDTDWGWAAKFGDFDNDGWEDLFAVDGLRSRGKQNYIPLLLEVIITPGIDFSDVDSYPDIGDMTWSGYQKQRLFHNLGDGTFKEIGAAAGVDNDLDGRGIGMADFDDDGRLDLYQTNANQLALLYMNRTEGAGNWVELELTGTRSNRDAIGARVRLVAGVGDRLETWIREVNGGNAYSSQSTKRLHFGLGAATTVESLEIRWPGGEAEKLVAEDGRPPIAVNAITRLVESEGVKR
jgi:ASPIC and UnbV/FG-GAP-like repeat